MTEHLDVLVIGAGLSGIGAAHHLRTKCPEKTFAILEARDAIGGTWDLFRYPGIRSDSDMYTFGYRFRPWDGAASIAAGPDILRYIRETAKVDDVASLVRLQHKVVAASWSSRDARWTIEVEAGPARRRTYLTCRFLFACTGYYDYAKGYLPTFPGIETFGGTLIHPQTWPEGLACANKRVVVIGSGATAITLVPALVGEGAAVTMLQRSPTYVVSRPARDVSAQTLRRFLPAAAGHALVRWRNIIVGMTFYAFARRRPGAARRYLLGLVGKALGPTYDVDTHFAPNYAPWDQRICLVPDGDLFRVLRSGAAEIVTDEIATFTEAGVRLRSGRVLAADIVVAATGLELKLLGGISLDVDGRRIEPARCVSYKGSMFGGIPNFAYALGYTNASWTLKCDLTCTFVCRLLNAMDRSGADFCVPDDDPRVGRRPLLSFSSGYIRRALDRMPSQGDRRPWRLNQNYLLDLLMLRFGRLKDGTLRFAAKRAEPHPAGPPVADDAMAPSVFS